MTPAARTRAAQQDLLLRETHHRCANDLQLVVGLLSLQSRRAVSEEARDALADATARVAVLARARAELIKQCQPSLQTALRQICEALHSQAEPRSILVSMDVANDVEGLSQTTIATLALVVNELATNAIKHAFEEGKSGRVSISLRCNGKREGVIVVDDDGLPFPEAERAGKTGLGLGLVKRLVTSVDALLIQPSDGTKRFEIRMPLQPA